MKLKLMALTALLSSGIAQAKPEKTSVEFDVTAEIVVNGDFKAISIEAVNEKLKVNGIPALPTRVSLNLYSKESFAAVQKVLEAARKLYNDDLWVSIDNERTSNYIQDAKNICYRGNPKFVYDVIEKAMGNYITDSQGLLAYRVGKVKKPFMDEFKTAKALRELHGEDNPEEVDAWNNYDKSSNTFLLMADIGPQGNGTQLSAVYIPVCK